MNTRDGLLRGLSKQRMEQLLALARTKTPAPSVLLSAPIESIPRNGDLPASFAQRRLWLINQLDRGATHYNIRVALQLRGPLNVTELTSALDALFERHESLRSVFVERQGEPRVHLLATSQGLPLIFDDLRTQSDPDAALAMIQHTEATTPFDLAEGPLIRSRLIQVQDESYLLILSQHHIISDGWSLGILAQELCELYAAKLQRREPLLSTLSIQYPDFAAWQHKELTRERLDGHLEYWRSQLEGIPQLLSLPTDRPRPTLQSTVGASVPISIDAALTARLKALALTHNTSLHVVLLAAWSIVLCRLSGQDDIIIGSPSANRDRIEIEPLTGFFVNMLALRIKLDGKPTIAELLARIRDTSLQAQAHQSVPFDLVVETLKPARRRDASPIFQVLFTLQNTREPVITLPHVSVQLLPQPSNQVKFDLELTLGEQGHLIEGSLNYATALYDAATMQRHRAYLQETLQSMVGSASLPALQMRMLPCEEHEIVTSRFSASGSSQMPSRLAHEAFEDQVHLNGAAIAVECDGQALTYDELNIRANRIAHLLRGAGIAPDQRVALFMPRCIEMLAALLGVLKAGAAYVPIDPVLPAKRLAYLLSDSEPQCVLAHSSVRSLLPDSGLQVLELDKDAELAAQPSSNIPRADSGLTDRHLAYVIYTSGSTGQPKGVMVEHRGLSCYLQWALQEYRCRAPMVSLVSSPITFDATITSLYLPLLSGGRALLLGESGSQDELATILSAPDHIDLVKITPSHLHLLGERLRRERQLIHVGCFVVGGEALPVQTVALWRELAPRTRIVNEYGPTEAVVGCTTFDASADFDPAASLVPIGRPVTNARIYIVDQHLQPVPIGMTGELLIGGPQVARGYLNQPELSQARFIDNPFDLSAGKVYRTGDMGRWRIDGSIEYLGRNDFQVKLRGFRIELAEIEGQLARVEGVQDVAVIARADGADDTELVAYVVPRRNAQLSALLVRHELAQVLPGYMLPSAFVLLPTLPLTANGKLDRDALPVPDRQARAVRTYEAPRGEVEELVARIWAGLLSVERVGRHDHFFELGGHSLMAARMLGRLQDELDLPLDLATVFDHPTLADFAESILMGIYARLGPSGEIEALIADITERETK